MVTFPKQFILTRAPITPPPGWASERIASLDLHYSPDLPLHRVQNSGSSEAGFLLGWPIGHDMSQPIQDFSDLGGRWVFISDEGHVQLDPLGSYSVVYMPDQGIAASSSGVVPARMREENKPLAELMGLPGQDHWYPFGLTPYLNIRRLLPHHILDLHSFRQKRVEAPFHTIRVSNPIETIAHNLKAQLVYLKSDAELAVGLTAGNESRMLLAGLKRPGTNCSFFTIGTSNQNQDVRTASLLAKRFKLKYSLHAPSRDADAEAVWSERVGHCVAGATLRNAKTKMLMDQSSVILKGIGGEVGRLGYFREGDASRKTLDPQEIVRRLGLPIEAPLIRSAEQWLQAVPFLDVPELVTFLHIENRVGCWAAPQLHGDVHNAACIWFLNQRSTIAAMQQLPSKIKLYDEMCPKVVAELWPELLTVPINQDFGLHKLLTRIRSGLRA